MIEKMRMDLTPQGYIRHMFKETKDGMFSVEYEGETKTFLWQWTAEDAEEVGVKYNLLTSALARIGRIQGELLDEESCKKLLSESDFQVFCTYVKPFVQMKVDWQELYPLPPCEDEELPSLIFDILMRSEEGDLIEEEEKLLKQYCMWEEEQSQKRIPFHRRSARRLIKHAMRYEKMISLAAPDILVQEEGRCLAEEMVLYYFGKEEPLVWD